MLCFLDFGSVIVSLWSWFHYSFAKYRQIDWIFWSTLLLFEVNLPFYSMQILFAWTLRLKFSQQYLCLGYYHHHYPCWPVTPKQKWPDFKWSSFAYFIKIWNMVESFILNLAPRNSATKSLDTTYTVLHNCSCINVALQVQ